MVIIFIKTSIRQCYKNNRQHHSTVQYLLQEDKITLIPRITHFDNPIQLFHFDLKEYMNKKIIKIRKETKEYPNKTL
jgi:hypothetical protein